MVKIQMDILNRLMTGVNTLADLVKSTLGPGGKLVLIKKGDYPPRSTKDGVTVANEVILDNSPEGTGAALVKQAAQRTVAAVGDGTTTATALAQSFLFHGIKAIEKGKSPVAVNKEITESVEKVVKALESNVFEAKDLKTLKDVATISANNDIELGSLIGDAVHTVGEYGDVKVESEVGGETRISYVQGYVIEKGFDSPFFASSGKIGDINLSDVLVALFDQKIYSFDDIRESIEYAAEENKSLVVVAHSFDESVLRVIVANQQKGVPIFPVQAQGVGDVRRAILGDIAALGGGYILPNDEDTIECLCHFEKVIIKKEETTFIDGNADEKRFNKLVEELTDATKEDMDLFTLSVVKQRLAKLMNGVAILTIGAETSLELGEVLDRVDDAIKATKAAYKGGVVLGGGVALVRAASVLDPKDIIHKSMFVPFHTICENAGFLSSDILKGLYKREETTLFDARSGTFRDFRESGVLDPLQVVVASLKAAESVAKIILNTSGIIYSEEKNMFL